MTLQRNLLLITIMCILCIICQYVNMDFSVYQLSNPQNRQQLATILTDSLGKIITVKTDVLSLQINTYGGDIEQALLLPYSNELDSPKPVHLLDSSKEFVYHAQSGLIGENGLDNLVNGNRPLYTSKQDIYVLENNQHELLVPLTYTANNIIYTKTFILKRSDFALTVNYYINNTSTKPLNFMLFGQLKQSMNLPDTFLSNNLSSSHMFRRIAYSTTYKKYKKYNFKELNKCNLFLNTNIGWIAMLQKYFSVVWVPFTSGTKNFYASNYDNRHVVVGFKSSPVTIAAGNQSELQASLWLGPEIKNRMVNIAKNLDLVVDYGLLRFISQSMLYFMKYIHHYISNWGFSIIIITFIIRIIMYPITKSQYTSIAKIRILQPKISAIRERFLNDKQRQNQEIIALYNKENINPLSSLLPMLIQMPIFLALYHVLSNSIELRHASFMLWIHDLSSQDPYYVLPIIMGITILLIQNISHTNNVTKSSRQQKIMTFMPLIFTVFFLWLPSGLILYYIVNNLVTIIQQQLIYRGLKKCGFYKTMVKK
ncbi:Inner membrane protein oxaA [Candidatus Moranella endobia PCVAL]|uniref:Membrane protein insertase YidC n=1 Tax=Moranella endobia (strain PCIT) TaxID=903503 RepID=F7XX55_MOREP|nr:membrane protein insertase YidC [Candidatus Moranella endobia]AEI74681.1 putative inner membrane protein translocase component YidC [Candidatus Moranella endobia PCIT]AGJ61337.1 Inner membrane protein oxaA [Candidatus Moranella endobia PCVAL]